MATTPILRDPNIGVHRPSPAVADTTAAENIGIFGQAAQLALAQRDANITDEFRQKQAALSDVEQTAFTQRQAIADELDVHLSVPKAQRDTATINMLSDQLNSIDTGQRAGVMSAEQADARRRALLKETYTRYPWLSGELSQIATKYGQLSPYKGTSGNARQEARDKLIEIARMSGRTITEVIDRHNAQEEALMRRSEAEIAAAVGKLNQTYPIELSSDITRNLTMDFVDTLYAELQREGEINKSSALATLALAQSRGKSQFLEQIRALQAKAAANGNPIIFDNTLLNQIDSDLSAFNEQMTAIINSGNIENLTKEFVAREKQIGIKNIKRILGPELGSVIAGFESPEAGIEFLFKMIDNAPAFSAFLSKGALGQKAALELAKSGKSPEAMQFLLLQGMINGDFIGDTVEQIFGGMYVPNTTDLGKKTNVKNLKAAQLMTQSSDPGTVMSGVEFITRYSDFDPEETSLVHIWTDGSVVESLLKTENSAALGVMQNGLKSLHGAALASAQRGDPVEDGIVFDNTKKKFVFAQDKFRLFGRPVQFLEDLNALYKAHKLYNMFDNREDEQKWIDFTTEQLNFVPEPTESGVRSPQEDIVFTDEVTK